MFRFVKTLPKQETENFARVLRCYPRIYLGLSPQFFAGKVCLSLQYNEKRKQDIIQIVVDRVGRVMGKAHEPKWT